MFGTCLLDCWLAGWMDTNMAYGIDYSNETKHKKIQIYVF
jgi:hypothetical protein